MGAFARNLSKIALKSPAYKIYGAGEIKPDRHWRMAPHSHDFHEIISISRGKLLLKAGGQALTAVSGDILFYRSGLVHEEQSDPKSPVGTHFISFDSGDLLPLLPLRIHDAGGRVHHLVKWIVEDELNRRAPEMKRLLFETLLGEMRRICKSAPDPWLEEILDFIHENFVQRLILDDLAKCGKMSKFAFVRKFRTLRGRTPMEELRLTRLDRARILLLTTNLSVKAISTAVGIGDEYQLSKLFRRYFDLSPNSLRTPKSLPKTL